MWHWKYVFVYLSGGECGRAAVSSVILAVGPIVDGVTPAIPSKGLDTSYKQETVLMFSSKWSMYLTHCACKTVKAKSTFPENRFSLSSRHFHTITVLCLEQMSTKQAEINTASSKSNPSCTFSHSRWSAAFSLAALKQHKEWLLTLQILRLITVKNVHVLLLDASICPVQYVVSYYKVLLHLISVATFTQP